MRLWRLGEPLPKMQRTTWVAGGTSLSEVWQGKLAKNTINVSSTVPIPTQTKGLKTF